MAHVAAWGSEREKGEGRREKAEAGRRGEKAITVFAACPGGKPWDVGTSV
jgi:hypothetical protein